MRIWLALCALVALPLYGADCYVGVGVGRSFINESFTQRLEDRIFTSGYANGGYSEQKSSTTSELQFGCVMSRRLGLKVELGMLEGFRQIVHTKGTAFFQGYEADFTVDRVARGRGYAVSGIWEKQLSERTYVFGRIGAIYATATVDIHPMGSEYSLHAEKEAWVPALGVGGRLKLDDRWSALAEYRIVGHPKVREAIGVLQYSFR